jgi:hypothetical protein
MNNDNVPLDLGWSQAYMAFQYHMEEAYLEQHRTPESLTPSPPIAIFSQKYYHDLLQLDHTKVYDFCFIGSMHSNPERRRWVIDFAKKYFTPNSVFINTHCSYNQGQWELLGPFDHSLKGIGYSPRHENDTQSRQSQYRVIEENRYYFETMCKSKFCLCPGGDAPWSFRFYEILMCKSIPVVETWHHTYRTVEEAKIPYKYVLHQNIEDDIKYDDYIRENTALFEKYHLLHA